MAAFRNPTWKNLPSLDGMAAVEEAKAPFSTDAWMASNTLVIKGLYEPPLPAGFRLTVRRHGVLLGSNGRPKQAKEQLVIVVDPTEDPVLQELSTNVQNRFENIPSEQERVTTLGYYVRRILEPLSHIEKNRRGDTEWNRYSKSQAGKAILLGWLLKKKLGPEVSMAVLLKWLADQVSLPMCLMQGAIKLGTLTPQPHLWCVRAKDGVLAVYDPAYLVFGEEMNLKRYLVKPLR